MKPSLTDADFADAAASLGVPVAAIKAVTAVESNGSGFNADGTPKILFERHVMYKRLKAAGKLPAHPPADIVNPVPGGYVGGTKEQLRLDRASVIDRPIALESASWGLFQIMGYHWKDLGYGTVQAFVNAMYASSAAQLDAFVRFVKRDPELLGALKTQNWPVFARGYNGPAYATQDYDKKLADAFDSGSIA